MSQASYFCHENVNKEAGCAQSCPLSNKLSGPLLEACFFSGALNTLSIYNKSSEALLAEQRHAPEEVCSQGDYLRHLKTALTWGWGNVNDCTVCNTVYLAVSDSQWPPNAGKSSLPLGIPLFLPDFFYSFFFHLVGNLCKFPFPQQDDCFTHVYSLLYKPVWTSQ